MPIRTAAAAVHEAHGSRFVSYLAPSSGSTELCAWRLEVAADLVGQPHRPSREEVLLILSGQLRVTLDGATSTVTAGDVVHVPAGCELRIDGGPEGATAWVTTSVGLQAELADGSLLSPPWAG